MTRLKHTRFSDMFWASLVLGMVIAQAFGGEKSGPNVIKEPEKPSATPTDVQTVTLAGQLAAWATANHDAVAMAAAARVLAADPPQTMEHPDKQSTGKPSAHAKPVAPDAFTVENLLKQARKMAGHNEQVLNAIDQIDQTIPDGRGHPGGAIVDHDILEADGTMTYTVNFAGGEPMEISVFADHLNVIDWHVFDENGNEIITQSADHFISKPKWTGPFKIVLTNTAGTEMPYTLATN